ncbi:hypothetical protein ACFSCX_07730 [Bacillus salitolerans]|uniref:Uncharacterized protein n=1 Tax=Bacillus salitolerans TaxID=1437434 RepID=A0ABW4LPL5_9BACI
MKKKISEVLHPELKDRLEHEIKAMSFTKNFRSYTSEEWYVFIPSFQDPQTGGAAGKVIIHYDLQGNREIFIHTTVIFDDPTLHTSTNAPLVYGIADELVNRLVGYADTLLSVHAGENSYQAEYKQ